MVQKGKKKSASFEGSQGYEKLLESIVELKKHNSTASHLYAWLAQQQLPNQRNLAALVRCVRDLEPAIGKHQCETVMAVLAMVPFCRVQEQLPWDVPGGDIGVRQGSGEELDDNEISYHSC